MSRFIFLKRIPNSNSILKNKDMPNSPTKERGSQHLCQNLDIINKKDHDSFSRPNMPIFTFESYIDETVIVEKF